jgi:hypothetical protein
MTNVKFDPGMGEYVVNFNDFINDVYSQLMNFRTLAQKRARFKLYLNKIQKYMQNNIAFYLGCLLWGYEISTKNSENPKEISNNPFLNYTKEQLEDYDYLLQVNFLENYFDSFERDTMYYIGKKLEIPETWKKILSLYSEFLEKNNGFVNTKLTSDVIIPDELKSKTIDFDITKAINKAIKNQDLTLLLDYSEKIL